VYTDEDIARVVALARKARLTWKRSSSTTSAKLVTKKTVTKKTVAKKAPAKIAVAPKKPFQTSAGKEDGRQGDCEEEDSGIGIIPGCDETGMSSPGAHPGARIIIAASSSLFANIPLSRASGIVCKNLVEARPLEEST